MVRFCMASDSGEILKSGTDRVTVQLQLIPTRYLQAQHRKKYPFRGDFFKSRMDHFMIQPHSIPTPLPHPTWENFPGCGDFFKSGMDRVTIQQNSIPTPLPHPTWENFPVCGEILKSGTDRVTIQQNSIPTQSSPCRTFSMISSTAISTFWRLAASLEA